MLSESCQEYFETRRCSVGRLHELQCIHFVTSFSSPIIFSLTFMFLNYPRKDAQSCIVYRLTGRGFPKSMRPSACTCRRDFENLLICDVALSHRCIAAGLTRGPI